jgi:hypothetical protein
MQMSIVRSGLKNPKEMFLTRLRAGKWYKR